MPGVEAQVVLPTQWGGAAVRRPRGRAVASNTRKSELLALKEFGSDPVQHSRDVHVDFLDSDWHDPIPLDLEPRITPLVVGPLHFIVVGGTYNLHDETRGRAAEVHEIRSYWVLPPELPTVDLTPA